MLSIPSPPIRGFYLGPLFIYFYSLCILAGIIIAAWWGRRRFIARGGDGDRFDGTILVVVIVGIIGARLYHVITDAQLYFGPGRDPINALNFRTGGLGIPGGIMLGAGAAWLMCRRHRMDFGSFADVIAPVLPLAQAMGRFGNWFNQELFGRPTSLPWALEIDLAHRPEGYENYETFHPTFLYEATWCALGAIVLSWAERRFSLGRGKLFSCYVLWYCFGRFFVEALRIDPVNHLGGFRLNNYVSLIFFVLAAILLAWQLRARPGRMLWPFGFSPKLGATR